MAIERRAVKKRVLKSGKDRTDLGVYILLKYNVTDNPNEAERLVRSKDEILIPSDLSYYNDQVEQDLGMGKSSPEVYKIRDALAEFYGLNEPEDDEMPPELEELLGDIRAEDLKEPEAPPPTSALAIYEGVTDDDIVEDEIDERILKLLQIDGVHDIDYGTYKTLLKEKMIAARMTDTSLATEESELLDSEYKRVKGKVGRFRLKKKKTITAEDLGESGPVTVSDDQFFLASAAVIPNKSTDTETEDDAEILKKLDDILKSIRMDNTEDKKKARKDKKDREEEKRRKEEAKLEKKKKKEFNNLIKTIIAPTTSILEKILNWIKFTFIGFIFNQALAWFQDPANQKKVEAIGGFLKAFWPAILAAAVLFLTPFGAFIRGTIKLLRFAIPKLLGLMKKLPPKALAAAALFGAGAIIPMVAPGTVNAEETKTKEAEGSKAKKIEELKKQKENLNPLQIIQGVGNEIDEQIKFLETGDTSSYGFGGASRAPAEAAATGQDNSDLDEMPAIPGMYGGGQVGGNIINKYFDIGNYGQRGFAEGGIVHNRGGSYNNMTTLGSENSFAPMFGFSGGGITLPNVNIPTMKTNINLMSGGGAVNVNDIRFAGGGNINNNTGIDITGAGPDTQLIAAAPGEIVMSREAVNHWGANTLLAMNKAGGGTNVPKMANNIQMAAGGGMVGGMMPSMSSGPSLSLSSGFGSVESPFHGPPTPGDSNYSIMPASTTPPTSEKSLSVSGPVISPGIQNTGMGSGSFSKISTAAMSSGSSTSGTGVMAEKIEEVEPNSKVISQASSNPLTSDLVMGGKQKPQSSMTRINYSPAMSRPSVSSSMAPVQTPSRSGTPNIIDLPTKYSSQRPDPIPAVSTPQLPKFSATKVTGKRSTTLNALGISDLVG